MVVRSGDAELRVRVPGASVVVPAGGAVVVVVRRSWFQVAAYSGRSRVEWADRPAVELPELELLHCESGACGSPERLTPAQVGDGEPSPPVESDERSVPAAHSPSRKRARLASAIVERPIAAEASTSVAPAPSPSVAATPSPSVAAAPSPSVAAAPPSVAPAPLPSALASESLLVEDALHAIRRAHDPARALLDTRLYRQRFPDGALAHEVDRIDVESLLALGRGGDALAVLERMPLDRFASARELQLIRGELRVQDGRCVEALSDFGAVLAAPADALGERALYGSAGCHARMGDRAGAERDLKLYLARFPDGAHADEIRRALRH
jgi:hypothetical protein